MPIGRPVGTCFAEISLDSTKLEKGLKRVNEQLVSGSINVEDAYKSLGIKSDQVYNMMRANATAAVDFIKNKTLSSKEEIVRAEKAAADKITAINEQQFGKQTSFLEGLKKHWLAVSAVATIALYKLFNFIKEGFRKAFKAIEEYQMGVITMSAVTVQFMERMKDENIGEMWLRAKKYAEALVPVIEEVAIETMLSGENVQKLATQFAKHGVILDVYNKKAIDGFKAMANAVAILTQGQGVERQIMSEINALMTGQTIQGAAIFDMLKKMIPNIKEQLELWKEQGTLFENLLPYLQGFDAASGEIKNTWLATKTTLDTTVNRILREGMKPVMEDIIKLAHEFNKYLTDHGTEIKQNIIASWERLKIIIEGIDAIIRTWKSVWYAAMSPIRDTINDFKEYQEAIGNIIRGYPEFTGVLPHELMSEEEKKRWIEVYETAKAITVEIPEMAKGISKVDEETKKLGKSFKELGKSFKELMAIYQAGLMMEEEETIAKRIQDVAKAYEWLRDHINKSTLSEYDYRRTILLKEYEDRAKLLEWTEELYEQFLRELRAIDDAELTAKINIIEKMQEAYKKAELTITTVTESELQKRLREWDEWYKNYVTILDEMLLADEHYNELSLKAWEIAQGKKEKIIIEASKSGIEKAIEAYEKSFMDLEGLTKRTLDGMADFFEDIFAGRAKDSFKNLCDYIKGMFSRLLAEMITMALARPIVVPIMTAIGVTMPGMTGTAQAAAGVGGTGILGPLGGIISTLTGAISNFGGMLMGHIGYMGQFMTSLGITSTSFLSAAASVTPFLPLIGPALMAFQGNWGGAIGGVIGFGGAMALGATLGSIVPGIGTIIGAILGTIVGGLFEKKKHPEAGVAWWTETPIEEYKPGKDWYARVAPGEGGFAQIYYKNMKRGFNEFAELLADVFVKVRKSAMETLDALGLDISGFYVKWQKWFGDLSGKSAEEVQALFKKAFAQYIQFASNIDFEQWRKPGEEFADTVFRILDAMQAFPKVLESFNDYVDAIKGDYDAIAKWKEGMVEAEKKIKDIGEALEEATDPADAVDYANQLKQIIYEKYMAEKQLIEGIRDTIFQLEMAMMEFSFNLQSRIDSLTGSANASAIALEKIEYIFARINEFIAAGNTGQAIQWVEAGVGAVDAWLSQTTSEIQARYAAMEEAQRQSIATQRQVIEAQIAQIEAQKKSIEAQIKTIGLQIESQRKQLAIIKGWSTLLESVKKTIFDLITTTASPEDVFERLGYAKSEMERIYGLYRGATGEERLGYAGQLQDLLKSYLSISQEAYQRPSPEYQSIYDSVLDYLNLIQTDAQSYANQEEVLQKHIASLEEQQISLQEQQTSLQEQQKALQEQANQLSQTQIDYSAAMNAEIQTAKNQAAEYYTWLKDVGTELYLEAIDDMKEKLASIIGDKTVEEYLADLQLAAVTELVLIRDLLEKVFNELMAVAITPPAPIVIPRLRLPYVVWPEPEPLDGYQHGGYVRKTGLAYVHAGEEVIPASRKRDSITTQTITIAPQITINATGDASSREIGKEVEKVLISSIKYGKARKVIQEMVRV